MNNLAFNALKQPAPNITDAKSVSVSQNAPKREIKYPNVGVVDAPNISKTPISDTIALKKQENPRTIYKLTPKSNKGFRLHNILSGAIIGCSVGALFSLLKKM